MKGLGKDKKFILNKYKHKNEDNTEDKIIKLIIELKTIVLQKVVQDNFFGTEADNYFTIIFNYS